MLCSQRCSRKMTGLSSSMLATSRPLASCGVDGITTLSPGTWENHACRLWACCGPCPQPRPTIIRMVSGTLDLPAEHVVPLGGLIADLIDRHHRELEPHVAHDRAHADEAGPERDPGHRVLGDRHVEDAIASVLLAQTARRAEHADRIGHAEPDEIRAAVAFEAKIDGFVNCLGELELALGHGERVSRRYRVRGPGGAEMGCCAANATASSSSAAISASIEACRAPSRIVSVSRAARCSRIGHRTA